MPSGAWNTHETEQGGTYYHNVETGESTWEAPPELQFLQGLSALASEVRATLGTEAPAANWANELPSVLDSPLSLEQDIAAASDYAWLPPEQCSQLRRAAACAGAAEASVLSLVDGSERCASSPKKVRACVVGARRASLIPLYVSSSTSVC